MERFYLKIQSLSVFTAPMAFVLTLIFILFGEKIESFDVFIVVLALWLYMPLLCKFIFMPKTAKLGWLVSIYPKFIKIYTVAGVFIILSVFSLFYVATLLVKM